MKKISEVMQVKRKKCTALKTCYSGCHNLKQLSTKYVGEKKQ